MNGLRILSRLNLVLILIIALGLGLRLWGIPFGLPYMYHPDEGLTVALALRMLQTGDWNPKFFHWSSLLFYANALVYFLYFIFGRTLGRFTSLADLRAPDVESIAVGKAFLPEEFLLGRGLTAICGTLAILMAYLVCRKMGAARGVGWVAALLLAVETIDVRNSQFIRPDTFVVLFELVTVWFCLAILDDPRARHYVGAGIAAGLATSFKYNAAVVCFAILVAHLFRLGWRGLLRREIFLAAFASIAAFLVTTPYALLDYSTFMQIGPLQAAEIYATGHAGAEGDTFNWYINFFWGNLGWVTPLGLAEIFYVLIRRERRGIVLLTFPFVYYVLVNLYTVHFDETALPIIPFLILFAALFLGRAYEFLSARFARANLLHLGFGLVACVFAFSLLRSTISYNTHLLERDARETARVWIEENLPPGSRIALEPYTPYIERPKFTVDGFVGMIAHPADWYTQNGFEYLIFSGGAYQRFYTDPNRYSKDIAQYDEFFERFALVKQFDEGGMQIRVYKTNAATLPAMRTATRWGIYAPWVELVGYDWRAPNLTLYWRTLEGRREPLQLTARLLGQDDRVFSQNTHALFSATTPGGKWLEGISLETFTIQPPPDSGLYRLELAVDTEGLGRIPVLSLDNKNLSDKFYLESLKFPPAPPTADELGRARSANARFGEGIVLLGYTIRNDPSRLALYWQSQSRVPKNYTVFIHLLDANGNLRAQIDRAPRSGAYPTSVWDVGEIIPDEYELPRDLASGEYRLELGMYEFPALTRLPITDSNGKNLGDHLILSDPLRIPR